MCMHIAHFWDNAHAHAQIDGVPSFKSKRFSFTYVRNKFLFRVNLLDKEKGSTEQDLNLHPSLYRQVPLPLDHLHYLLLLVLNS